MNENPYEKLYNPLSLELWALINEGSTPLNKREGFNEKIEKFSKDEITYDKVGGMEKAMYEQKKMDLYEGIKRKIEMVIAEIPSEQENPWARKLWNLINDEALSEKDRVRVMKEIKMFSLHERIYQQAFDRLTSNLYTEELYNKFKKEKIDPLIEKALEEME